MLFFLLNTASAVFNFDCRLRQISIQLLQSCNVNENKSGSHRLRKFNHDYIARLKAGSEICLRQSKLLLRSIEIRLRRSKLNPALLGSVKKICQQILNSPSPHKTPTTSSFHPWVMLSDMQAAHETRTLFPTSVRPRHARTLQPMPQHEATAAREASLRL